ncbi:hypothetical protein MRX96_046563 [Rhipicephalus microplus]
MTRMRSPSSRHREEEMRVTRLMTIIFALFLLCFLPLLVANLLEAQITKRRSSVLSDYATTAQRLTAEQLRRNVALPDTVIARGLHKNRL